MHWLQKELLQKYCSEYMQTLINNSPIFKDHTTGIYNYVNNLRPEQADRKCKALIEGRIGEISFSKNYFFGSVFKYNGDVNVYTFTKNHPNVDYSAIDFSSRFRVGVDVKMLGPTAIRQFQLKNGKTAVREAAFNDREINHYLSTCENPFLLIFSDTPFFSAFDHCHGHYMFVNLREAYNHMNDCDTMDTKYMNGRDGVHNTYRINLEYFGEANRQCHYLLNILEFFNYVRSMYYLYDEENAYIYDVCAKMAKFI